MLAVVMAGGEGRRLHPLTLNRPKPMVPVLDKPILEYTVRLLRRSGFRRIVMTLHYLSDRVIQYFGDGGRLGVEVSYSVEEKPLGTAGGVKAAVGGDERILVWSGDVLSTFDIKDMIRQHKKSGAIVTMAATYVDDPTRFGMILADQSGKINGFVEKPSREKIVSNLINCGVYVLEPEVLKLIPDEKFYDFSRHLFPRLLKDGFSLYAYVIDGFWSDIGTPSQYLKVNLMALQGGIPGLEIEAKDMGGRILVSDEAEVDEAEISGPAYIGSGVRLRGKSIIGPNTIIGSRDIVGRGVTIRGSVVWEDTVIHDSAKILGAIVGNGCVIGRGAEIMEDSIVSDSCKIGGFSVIKPEAKIWPGIEVKPHTVVSEDLRDL